MTRENVEMGQIGQIFPVIPMGNEYGDRLGTCVPSVPTTPQDLPGTCNHCGGYLPQRLRTGGIHLLCAHHYDDQMEVKK